MRLSRGFRVFCPCHVALACAGLALAGCYDDEFPSTDENRGAVADAGHDDHGSGGCETGAAAPTVELAVSPAHLHPGVVATLTFTVAAEGEPVADLSPTLVYSIDGGEAVGPLPVSAGETAGTYAIERTLAVEGTYALSFEFTACERAESFPFEVVLGGGDH